MKPNNCNGFDEWSQKRNWWGKELQVAVRRRTFMNLLSLNWFLGNTHSCAIKAHWISVSHLGMNIQSPKPQVITHPADILCRRVICKDKETKQHITSGCTFHQVAVSQCWVTAFPRPLSKDDVTRSKAKLRSDEEVKKWFTFFIGHFVHFSSKLFWLGCTGLFAVTCSHDAPDVISQSKQGLVSHVHLGWGPQTSTHWDTLERLYENWTRLFYLHWEEEESRPQFISSSHGGTASLWRLYIGEWKSKGCWLVASHDSVF